jgi:hypothetical protein
MSSPLFGVIGLALLLLILCDLGVTILRLDGPGPLTGRLAAWSWRALLRLRSRGWITHRTLSLACPLLLLALLSIWCCLTWLSWTLIFSASPHALQVVRTGRPARMPARSFFVGQTLSTLGNAEVEARGPLWRLASSLCGLNGFFLLTLTVTYLLPLFDAAACKRATAIAISGLGRTPEEILRDKWAEPAFHQRLSSINDRLVQQSVNHRAYPVLHFFHSSRTKQSLALQIAILDEALTLLECGAARPYRLPRAVHQPLRDAIGEFLATVSHMYDPQCGNDPQPRSLEGLTGLVPETLDPDSYRARVAGLLGHRRALKGMVEGHGWAWEHVQGTLLRPGLQAF